MDQESRDFVERELEETREVFRTASGELQLDSLCRDVFAAASTTGLRRLKHRGVDPERFYLDESPRRTSTSMSRTHVFAFVFVGKVRECIVPRASR